MVVLAASICTRGGKAIVSRQFREMQRSRVEALLAAFPKLATAGAQHTTVEQDNVRYVYQPLDELFLVLITNRQSNILQDIDSLHLFAQVVSSICKSLEEREIIRHAFELISAFDELVTLGYRENLTLAQIKTFLDMDSHEERIQEIIARNKELEASEERKRKAKQLEMQRKEMARSGRSTGMGSAGPRTPQYPTYTAPANNVPDTYESYKSDQAAAKKPLAVRGKGMQLGKKTKTGNAFEQIRGDLGPEAEMATPLIAPPAQSSATAPAAARTSTSTDREPIHLQINETIKAKLSREGTLESLEVKGDLQLRITDASLTQVRLNLDNGDTRGATLSSHPKVDKALFKSSNVIQIAGGGRGFPANQNINVMRWTLNPKAENVQDLPITFTVWVNESGGGSWNITVEYEFTGGDALKDVRVTLPYSTNEPSVSSHDAVYEVAGDSLEWNIGTITDENANGSFEFEAEAGDDADFFPMQVHFAKSTPYVEVNVASVTLINEEQDVGFSKDVKSVADKLLIG